MSRKSYMGTVDPLTESIETTRLQLWANHRTMHEHGTKLPIETKEKLPPGNYTDWPTWKFLYMFKWGYHEMTACKCGEAVLTMDHLSGCRLVSDKRMQHMGPISSE